MHFYKKYECIWMLLLYLLEFSFVDKIVKVIKAEPIPDLDILMCVKNGKIIQLIP